MNTISKNLSENDLHYITKRLANAVLLQAVKDLVSDTKLRSKKALEYLKSIASTNTVARQAIIEFYKDRDALKKKIELTMQNN